MPVIVDPGAPSPPAPTTAVSLDGHLRVTSDQTSGGVLLQADYSAEPTPAYQVEFRRDGALVRSGAPAWAPGGYALAYDFEAPLGALSAWTATPLLRDSATGVLTAGTPTDAVALAVPDLSGERDFWLKSVSDPGLSLQLISQAPDPEIGQTARNALADIPGSPLASGSWDVALAAARTFRFLLSTLAERDALLRLLAAGPMLVQSLTLYGLYDFFALPGDVSEAYFVGAFSPARVVTLVLVPIDRPSPVGAPLYVPGRSYADVDAAYPDYDTLNSAKPDYLSLVAS